MQLWTMLKALIDRIVVGVRPQGKASVFHIKRGPSGLWHYTVERGGNIKSSSETYYKKWNAKRAAYAAAREVEGATVLVDPTAHE